MVLKTETKIKLGSKILPILVGIYLKIIFKNISNQPNDFSKKIFVFWHKNMFLGWWLFRNKSPYALVSQSSDGEILTRVLKKWNYNVIRGSSSKGGKVAINILKDKTNTGNPIIITPDGPRGPDKEFKNGPLVLSLEGNYKIIPVRIIYKNKLILSKSWDKFEIPLPFSKCYISFGDTFCYNEYLNEQDLINFKNSICEQM